MIVLLFSYVVSGGMSMKSTWKIIAKLALIGLIFYVTPFYDTLFTLLSQADIKTLAYTNKTVDPSISLKDELNVLSYQKQKSKQDKEVVKVETTQENPVVVPTPKKEESKESKTVYIYDTHQGEEYNDGKGVMDAAADLGARLEKKGIKVVLETHSFQKYMNEHGMDYNQSYFVSNKFLQDALVNYGGFDLCIDLHRDSIPREASILEANGKTYAKAMMVVGGLATYADSSTQISSTLTDIMNKKVNGIMKGVMTREAYYNQQVAKNIVLIEVGAEVNSFEEITNTTSVLADGIYDLLMKGG